MSIVSKPLEMFGGMKIKSKIILGFMVVLALLATVSGLSISSFDQTKKSFDAYLIIAGNTVKGAVLDGNFVRLRRLAIMYGETGDDKIVGQFRDLSKSISKEYSDLISKIINPERKYKLTEVAKQVEIYTADFEKASQVRATRDMIVNEKLNVWGASATTNLSEIMTSAMADKNMEVAAVAGLAQESLMLARLNANRFIAKPDAKLVDASRQASARVASAIVDLLKHVDNPKQRQLAQETADLSKNYTAAIDEVAAATLALDGLINGSMAKVAGEIADKMDDIRHSQMKTMEEIDTETGAMIHTALVECMILSLGAVTLGLVLAWLISRAIANPIIDMTQVMKKLATGDVTTEIQIRDRRSEIGHMAMAIQVFKDNMIESTRLRAEQEETKKRTEIEQEESRKRAEAEREEMRQQAEAEKRVAMNKMADDFESTVKAIVQIVSSASTELQSTAGAMSATAEETSRQSAVVAASSEQASSNVQTVAAATQELSSSITEIARQVAESAKIAGQAAEGADRTNATVRALAESADKIGDIVNMINDIASQTNLLALNATIEAARAGDAGKGFAVVAAEVKSLANQTAKATDEISAQVTAIQSATGDSVTAIASIAEIINRVNEIATTISAAVEEQGAATQEIARNVQQVSSGTVEVTTSIGSVTRAANDTGAAAGQVLSASSELSKQSSLLSDQVDAFVAKIRAA